MGLEEIRVSESPADPLSWDVRQPPCQEGINAGPPGGSRREPGYSYQRSMLPPR